MNCINRKRSIKNNQANLQGLGNMEKEGEFDRLVFRER